MIGHRGAPALRPEHTLASYGKAIADGADFIEPDLVMTKDGVMVARHENEIGGTTDVASHPEFAARKTSKTIDGHAETGWFTEDFTLAELKTLRARERLPQLRSTQYDGEFQVPTLDEIIDFVAAESAVVGHPVGIIPEIKHGSYFQQLGLPMEDRLLALLAAHSYTRTAPVEIQSFEITNLKYLRGKLGTAHPNIRLLQLIDAPEQRPYDVVVAGGKLSYGDMLKRRSDCTRSPAMPMRSARTSTPSFRPPPMAIWVRRPRWCAMRTQPIWNCIRIPSVRRISSWPGISGRAVIRRHSTRLA